MGRTLYLDCFSGISGDMLLGALANAGLPLEQIGAHLYKLEVASEFNISAAKVYRHGLEASRFVLETFVVNKNTYSRKASAVRSSVDAIPEQAYRKVVSGGTKRTTRVVTDQNGERATDKVRKKNGGTDKRTDRVSGPVEVGTRSYPELRKIVSTSSLSEPAKNTAREILQYLAEAEARVHGTIPERVMFDDIGAVERTVEAVGVAVGLELLEIDRVVCSPLPLSRGVLIDSMGPTPIPSPVGTALLEGVPVVRDSREYELVSPMGAAIVKALATSFGGIPAMKVVSVGFGAGAKDQPGLPHVLRVLIGEDIEESSGAVLPEATVWVSATLGAVDEADVRTVFEALRGKGVLDAYSLPITNMDGRRGVLVECVVQTGLRATVEHALFEAGASSVRCLDASRRRSIRG